MNTNVMALLCMLSAYNVTTHAASSSSSTKNTVKVIMPFALTSEMQQLPPDHSLLSYRMEYVGAGEPNNQLSYTHFALGMARLPNCNYYDEPGKFVSGFISGPSEKVTKAFVDKIRHINFKDHPGGIRHAFDGSWFATNLHNIKQQLRKEYTKEQDVASQLAYVDTHYTYNKKILIYKQSDQTHKRREILPCSDYGISPYYRFLTQCDWPKCMDSRAYNIIQEVNPQTLAQLITLLKADKKIAKNTPIAIFEPSCDQLRDELPVNPDNVDLMGRMSAWLSYYIFS